MAGVNGNGAIDLGMSVTRQRGDAAGGQTGGGDNGSGIPSVRLPGVFIPPRGATYFNLQSALDTAAILVHTFPDTLKIPEQMVLVINTIQFATDNADPVSLANHFFRLIVGGAPLEGFEKIKVPMFGGAQGLNSSPVYIEVLPKGGEINIVGQFNDTVGGAHHSEMLVQGWFYPMANRDA